MSPRQEDQEGGIGEGFTQAHDFCSGEHLEAMGGSTSPGS